MLEQFQSLLPRFNTWVAGIWPGAKTKITNAILAISGSLLIVTQMFDVIDIRQYVETKTAGYILLGVALLNYWLKVVTDKSKEIVENVA